MVIKLEIKPTTTTSHILMTIINDKPDAYACVMGNDIFGTVCFYKYLDGSIMIYEIKGLPVEENSGVFGFHIHEGETCSNDTATPYEKTKNHFNPTNSLHPFHLGDLPPLFARKGMAWGIVYMDKFKPQDIVGRTIVIHAHADDFHTQPSGNSGTKIACGEIQRFQK